MTIGPPHPEDEPVELQRRRGHDAPGTDMNLLLWRLSQVESAIKEGFVRLETRFDGMEKRVASLEAWRDREEGQAKALAAQSQNVNSRWIPILIASLGAMVTIVIFLLSQGGPS